MRDDFDALAAHLPSARNVLPAGLYSSVVDFVMESGDLTDLQRDHLAASRVDGSGIPVDSTLR